MGATADGGRTVNGPRPARGSVRPVAAFLALALGGTWSYDLVVGWWLDGWDRPWVGDLRILGPTAAAVVVTGATAGRAGLEDLWRATTRWRVGLPWYAVALLGVPACYAVAVLVTPGAEAAFDPPSASLLLLYPLLIPAAAVLGGPLFEEPGWRGVLLPHLLALTTPVRASVVVGLVWAAWHATQYLDANFEADPGLRQLTYDKLLDEEQTILGLPEKYRSRIREEDKLMRLLKDAHAEHDAYLAEPGTTGDAREHARIVQ